MLGKMDIHMQKNRTGPLCYTIHKNKLKMYKDLNVRPETIKLLEANISSKSLPISLSNIFPDMPPRARETKAKINYWDYNKLRKFCPINKQESNLSNERGYLQIIYLIRA